MLHIILDGSTFHDLDGFYEAIYGLMTLNQDWSPAHNLDALNDMLYGGFGTEPVAFIWKDAAKSKADLGLPATIEFYQKKIEQGRPFNVVWAQQQLDDLNIGNGQTLFDIIVSILQDHKHIQLTLQ